MAIRIEEGMKLHATMRRGGQSSVGNWEMIPIKEYKKNGKVGKEIIIFVSNCPSGMPDSGGDFVIDRIEYVNYTAKKDKNDVWHDAVNVGAKIQYIPEESLGGLEEDTSDAELPWDMQDELPL